MSSESIDCTIEKLNNVDQTIPPWAILIVNSMKEILCQLKNTNEMISKVNNLEANVEINKNVSERLVVENQRLKNELLKLRSRVDDNEQRNRNLCLLLHGVEESDEEKTDEMVIEAINNEVGVHISINDIERSHRLGPKKTSRVLRSTSDNPRPIILRFSSFRKRDEVFRNKRKLKGKSISLSENLTKEKYTLYQEATRKLGKGKAWTVEGRILTKIGNRLIIIKSSMDIDNLVDKE